MFIVRSSTELAFILGAFLTMAPAIFVAELTDKDALLLLAISTKIKPWTAFAAGSTAFGISTAIIASFGYLLIRVFPVYWIKLIGGFMMIGYALYEYARSRKDRDSKEVKAEEEEEIEQIELAKKKNRAMLRLFLSIVSMLVILDLAGDATEVLTIVFVAHYENVLLVFVSCWVALIVASALETTLGNRLGRYLSFERIRIFSLLIFLVIGTIVIATTIAFP